MNQYRVLGTCVLIILLNNAVGAQSATVWDPKFYPYCAELGVPGLEPRSFPDQVRMFKEAGFDGIGFFPIWIGGEMDRNLKTADEAGMPVYMFGLIVNLKADEPYD